jgi:hypothetical protein
MLTAMLVCGVVGLEKGLVIFGGVWAAILARDVRRWRNQPDLKSDRF